MMKFMEMFKSADAEATEVVIEVMTEVVGVTEEDDLFDGAVKILATKNLAEQMYETAKTVFVKHRVFPDFNELREATDKFTEELIRESKEILS